MKRRVFGLFAGIFALVSCVDLFHSTDVETACDKNPGDPACTSSAITTCTTGNEARRLAERSCAWLGACEGGTGRNAFSSCMVDALRVFDCDVAPERKAQGDLISHWSCLASADSCGDVDKCVYGEKSPPVCDDASLTYGCVDERVYTVCNGAGRPANAEDCSLLGKVCSGGTNGIFGCTGAQKRSCAQSGCKGDRYLVSCSNGVDYGFDCNGYQTTCDSTGTSPVCKLGGAPCDQRGAITCKEGFAQLCGGDGHLDTVNCTALGRTCAPIAQTPEVDPIAGCVGAEACTDGCAGGVMTSCSNDTRFTFNCKDVGLECTNENGHARCAVPIP